MELEVLVLRQFRDTYLLTNKPGQMFVKFYYATSPTLASFISKHENLRIATRMILTPVVWGCTFSLHSPTTAVLLAISMIIMLVTAVRIKYRRVHVSV